MNLSMNNRTYLNESQIEIVNPDLQRGRIKFAIFDFDGTISLIREGWQQIMIPMMVDILMETPSHESRPEIEGIVRRYVTDAGPLLDRLNKSGSLYLTHTRLDDRLTLRFCVGQTRTEFRHVAQAWKRIQAVADDL